MARKAKVIRALDVSPTNQQLAPAPDASTADLAPPLPSTALEPPVNLALVAALARSASTPTALINATWDGPAGVGAVEKYTVQWSTSNTFPAASTVSADTFYEGAVIDGLLTSTLYYVRVSAWAHGIQSQWSAMVPLTTGVNRVTTPADTIAPAIPTAASAAFVNAGDLRIVWTEPTLTGSPNFRDVEVTIWDSAAKGTNLLTDYSATGQYIFTAAMNGKATSYVYDPVVYVELRSRSWGNQFSAPVVVGTITKAVPANPVVTPVWDGATGSLIFDWTDIADAGSYELTLDGKLYPVAVSRYVYAVDRNRADHAGTPDPAITYLLKAVDRLLQRSTGVTATTTLARPATPTGLTSSWAADAGLAGPDCTISWASQVGIAFFRLTIDGVVHDQIATRRIFTLDANRADHAGTPDPVLSLSLVAVDGLGQTSTTPATLTATNVAPPTTAIVLAAGFSAVAISATPSAAGDLRDYTLRIIKDTVTLVTYRSSSPDVVYKATAGGSYQVGVKVNDLFGQQSTETVSAAVVLDALTIEELRSALSYTSDDGQTQADLDKLKDGDTTTAATGHALSATAWRTITAMRALLDRYKTITLFTGGIAAGTLKVYFGTSIDGVAFTWYSGPLQPTGATGQNTTLVAYGVEANAQTNAITVAATTGYRFELSAFTEARYIALKHRDTTGAYNLREFYPRRGWQTDDFDAESIRSINIGADQVLADHIFVLSLSAIVADIGQLTITNPAGAAWIYQGTGTGAAPTTGLKIFNSGGIGKLSTYNATVEQVTLDTDGKLKWAAGTGVMDANGISIIAPTGPATDTAAYRFLSGAAVTGTVESNVTATVNTVGLRAKSVAGHNSAVGVTATTPTTKQATVLMSANGFGTSASLSLDANDTGSLSQATIQASRVYLDGAALDVGAAAGGGPGDISAAGGLNLGTATGAPAGAIAATVADASTNSIPASLTLGHNTSAMPVAGFGADILVRLQTTTTPDTSALLLRTTWAVPTHASRTSRAQVFVYDTTAREALRMEASGSAPMIAFLGAAAVARQSIGAAAPAGGTGTAAGGWDTAANRNAAITLLNNIRTALINDGLCQT